MATDFESAAAMFFTDPATDPESLGGHLSVLYLLRRDIIGCLERPEQEPPQFGFPATMTILAGIDLLGKFRVGDDKHGCSGWRFKSFLEEYFLPCSSHDAIIIYLLRNAMMHSFGLYAKDNSGEYHLGVTFGGDALIHTNPDCKTTMPSMSQFCTIDSRQRWPRMRRPYDPVPTCNDAFFACTQSMGPSRWA